MTEPKPTTEEKIASEKLFYQVADDPDWACREITSLRARLEAAEREQDALLARVQERVRASVEKLERLSTTLRALKEQK